MIIKHVHMRELGYCNKGGRALCKTHGIDWAKFVSEGVPEEVLLAIDNAMAIKVVENAHG